MNLNFLAFHFRRGNRADATTMKTTALQLEEFANTVLAVPPLARHADLSINVEQNRKLVQHIESGDQRILLYGGNANLYHCGISDYAQMLEMLADAAAQETRVIPAIGPDFGKMMDQAGLLSGSGYQTAMMLPMQGFTSEQGVSDGIRRFVDAARIPITLYLKSESYIDVDRLGGLVDEGLVLVVKYAVVRADPARDPFLERLIDRISARRIVSGMGERPAPVHLTQFGLVSFTTGCGCIAPKACMQLLQALQQGDKGSSEALMAQFMPLETLRESVSLIRVLHDAVSFCGIADMGAQLPLLSGSPPEVHAQIKALAQALLAFERSL